MAKSILRLLAVFALVSALVLTVYAQDQGAAVTDAVLPVVIEQAPPVYPKELKKKPVRGEAVVEFIVDTEGKVKDAKIVRQTHEAFGAAALTCVKKWRFKPGTKGGVRVNCLMQVPLIFEP